MVLPSLLVAVAVVASCSSTDPKPSAKPSTPVGSTSPPTASATPSSSSSPTISTAPTSAGPSQKPKLTRVDVTTTFAAWSATSGAVEVGGYATVVEPAGTCTLRLIHGAQFVKLEHAASVDATTVACGFSVPRKTLTAGQWQAVLAYTSSRSTGEAAAVSVKVP